MVMGHGAAQKPSKWQEDHVSLGPCYSECQTPGLELPSSRRIKIRALGLVGASQEQRDGSEWAVRRARRGLKLLMEEEFNQEWLICADILLQTPWV